MHTREVKLRTYAEFRPSQFDAQGLGLPERQGWYVAPCSHTRDSDVLEESNWHVMLESLGGEADTVEVHRFGHWGPGWFEIVLVSPASPEKVLTAMREIEIALADYPVLDECDFNRREDEAAQHTWEQMSLRVRIAACAQHRVSIFAARRDYVPENDSDLRIYLASP